MNSWSLRKLIPVFLILFLTACGGGGTSLDGSDSDTGSGGTGSDSYTISLQLTDTSNVPATEVRAEQPLIAKVVIKDASGKTVSQRAIRFETTLGRLDPVSGTALTSSQGEAEIELRAGSIQGAGEITASFDEASTTTGFYTLGDEIDNVATAVEVTAQLYNCTEGETPPSDGCDETSNITQLEPGILLISATVEGASTPVSDALVSVETDLGTLIPEIGTAVTNEQGVALITILAGSDIGAGEYSVTVEGATYSKAFNIGAIDENGIDIQVADGLNGAPLAAGSSTVIEMQVFEGDGITPYPIPLDIELSSSCISAGTALIDSPVTTTNGVAHATYTAAGCVGTDTVFLTIATGGQSFNTSHAISVDQADVGAIEFVSVSEEFIAIQQAGGLERPTTSVVTFRLFDQNNNPVTNREIEFKLNTSNGGVSLDPLIGFTDAQGFVRTTVTSGTVPTPIRISASYSESGTVVVSQVSDGISIGTGLADNNSFTLAVETFNVEGLTLAGIETAITAFAADHFNNPVPDGTVVQFTTEGGAVFPPSCQTVDGTCSVTWRSQDPRPLAADDPRFNPGFNFRNTLADAGCGVGTHYGIGPCLSGEIIPTGTTSVGPQAGRATVMAFMLGEESFADANNNGQFDPGEFFVPLDDAFVDHNENSKYDGNEEQANAAVSGLNLDGGELEEFFDNPIPEQQDGEYSPANSPESALYQGTLCSEAAEAEGHCTVKAVHARRNNIVVMSGSNAYFRVIEDTGDSDGELDVRTGPDSALIYISDIYNNPMPAGSTISVSARDVVLLTDASYEYPNTTTFWGFGLSVKAPDEPKGDGFITITITTPSGVATQIGISVKVI